ncbi:MAG: cytochrome-c peroxidase [Sphingomonas sp. SCN 67-18]|uniref:cytochrome-c peroxidase n=1 Tax=uncultured Sphingomonas sp. TaxID=158754 RepID=UPI00086E9A3D|nr:cytochrome c peroxidase [Sphingomonas sp. SCN 67-18]ODU21318.1 MAG: cytochrome-c peroxidase [Sphingomonas sp. SCN 67-18]
MKRLLCALALLVLTAAAPGWRWSLPDGMAPPPVPAANPMSAARVELGRRLFYDADLSLDGTLACSSCHEQRHGFADSVSARPGVHGDPGRRNASGLANVGWLSPLTYADPTLATLEAQALVPLVGETPVEMGMKGMDAELARRLSADRCYRTQFARAFPGSKGRIDLASVVAALAAFQRTMVSAASPWDDFRRGDAAALTPLAQQGVALFESRGCAACHAGPQLTDLRFHGFAPPQARDPGLVERTGRAEDAGRFRTPSLRNVAVGGPWWHDGSAKTLDAAIRRHAAAVAVTDTDMPALLALLESFTDPHFITDPRLSRPDRACGKKL